MGWNILLSLYKVLKTNNINFYTALGMVLPLYIVNKVMEEMKKSEQRFYKVLIAVIYIVLAALVVAAFIL
jgi:hypothetical protein